MLRDKERPLSERLSEVGSEGAEKSGLLVSRLNQAYQDTIDARRIIYEGRAS